MKRIIEAVVSASNLAYMVREGDIDRAKLQDAADKTLRRLDNAMTAIRELGKEIKSNG